MRNIAFLFLVACTGVGAPPDDSGTDPTGSGDDWQPVSYVDEGEPCFENQGADVAVNVRAPGCLSSSCSRDLGGTCTATVSGNAITLTSEVHWEQNVGLDVACTDDCGSPTVSCTIPALPDGTYTVTFGTEIVEVVVPTVGACADSTY